MKENIKNNNNKIVLAILIIILLLIIVVIISNLFDNEEISKVKKVLSEKYDKIECIDINCEGIITTKYEDNISNIKLYDENGNVVAGYSESQNTQNVRIPFALSKNYFLSTVTDNKEKIKYTISDKKGKDIYTTDNKLQLVNDYFIVMNEEGKIGDIYTIIDRNGKELYSNISKYESYLDGKYIYFEKENEYFLLDEKGNKIIENYKINDVVIDDEDNILYFVLKDIKSSVYYYFDVEKSVLVGEGFDSYKINSDSTLTVTKRDTSNDLSYNINIDGKKDKLSIKNGISPKVKEIKSKINEDYYLYTLSVISDSQNKVLVDNKKEKSFGIYDVKSEKYTKLYSYNSDNYYSSLSILDSIDDHIYAQISCNLNVCESPKMIVFDLTNSNELFRLEGTTLVAQNYVQYENGYKMVKYSYQSSNSDYKGKYALYDSKNKELLTSNNQIVVIDSKYVMGDIKDESLILYSSNDRKILNNENSLSWKIKISDKIYYKYNLDDNVIIIDSKGKEIYRQKNNNLIEYSDKNIYSIGKENIDIYNIKNNSENTYKLLNNEQLVSSLNNRMYMFKDALFINNPEDDYFKIINSKGKQIKKINNTSIETIISVDKKKRAYMITKKKIKDKIKYGLYIAK